MGVIKNDVGRPSNKTIMIRRILKLILILIIVGLAVTFGYFIKDNETSNKTADNISKGNNVNKEDYSKYLKTWPDDKGSSELEILNIGNNWLTFTWRVYRTAIIEYTAIPIKDNTAIFYYQGYDDKNYNSLPDDDEHYCRKVTIKLNDDNIVVKVENVSSSEYDLSLGRSFDDGVYINESTYNYKIK